MTEFLHQVVKKRDNPCTFLPGCLCQSCERFVHIWDRLGEEYGDTWRARWDPRRVRTDNDITIEAI
jgi:hypothetical protein